MPISMTNNMRGIIHRIGFPSQVPNSKVVAAKAQEMLMAIDRTANAGRRMEPRTTISTMKMPMTTRISMLLNCSVVLRLMSYRAAVEPPTRMAEPLSTGCEAFTSASSVLRSAI